MQMKPKNEWQIAISSIIPNTNHYAMTLMSFLMNSTRFQMTELPNSIAFQQEKSRKTILPKYNTLKELHSMVEFFQQVVGGIETGSMYALAAMGLVLI